MEGLFQFSKDDIEIIDVSPAQARMWLEKCNVHNRRMSLGHVKRIVLQMKKGQWLFNGDTICFDWNGNLIDGQHRLQGISESGITVKCIIVRNLDPKCLMTKDIEMKPRNLSDLLSVDKIKDPSCVAAIVARFTGLCEKQSVLVGGNEIGSPMDTRRMDTTVWDKYEIYYKYSDLFDKCVLYAHRYNRKRQSFLRKAEIGSLISYLCIIKKHDIEKVISFFEQLYFGNEECPAINSLRDKLNRDTDKGSVMMGSYKQMLFVKTWNYYITGASNKTVNYNPEKDGKIWFK